MLESPVHRKEEFIPVLAPNCDSGRTVAVYTRHKPQCPNKCNPYWRRCRCTKYLYIYANGSSRQISARTKSWEKAEQQAQQIRDSLDPVKQAQQEIQHSESSRNKEIEIRQAADDFLKEVERLNREEATRKKYKPTLSRLATWCAAQVPTWSDVPLGSRVLSRGKYTGNQNPPAIMQARTGSERTKRQLWRGIAPSSAAVCAEQTKRDPIFLAFGRGHCRYPRISFLLSNLEVRF